MRHRCGFWWTLQEPGGCPAASPLPGLTHRLAALHAPQGVTFACINAAGPADETGKQEGGGGEAAGDAGAPAPAAAVAPKLATFALRIKAPDVLDQFVAAVNAHKAGSKKASAEDAA